MSHSPLRIQCANPECLYPDHEIGQVLCDRCQTPLVYRYLWAVDAADIPVKSLVADRYWVVGSQIWLDTQPGKMAEVPVILPEATLPYLYLYANRLHVPGLYGFCTLAEDRAIVLLENAPIAATGQLNPSLQSAWKTASPVRQVYWLWQLLQLWKPLKELGVATSLLTDANLYVEGWRVRLRELIPDAIAPKPNSSSPDPSIPPSELDTADEEEASLTHPPVLLKALGAHWLTWLEGVHPSLAEPLQAICQQMQSEDPADFEAIATQLNRLLLEQAAQLPLHLSIAGSTTTGPQRSHNEDTCFPTQASGADELLPWVGIICDGIGGHEGGEVASQLALRSLQLQLRALLTELAEQPEPLPAPVVEQQLAGIVRVVNNLIAGQNDEQGRSMRQRMGTTLVMALQLPQRVAPGANAHELYLVHVGDSRAYWLTPDYCHSLTVDDDVATREVLVGRSPYQEALHRPDGGALTQALGTRTADLLEITVQRFILEEDGVLLLCSDGLSDCDRVEQSWQPITQAIFAGELSPAEAVQAWIELANQQNGHDNTSVVLLRCQMSVPAVQAEAISLPETKALPPAADVELADSSRALLYDEAPLPPTQIRPRRGVPSAVKLMGLGLFAFAIGLVGVAIWQQFDQAGFWQTRNGGESAPPASTSSP